MKPTTRHWQLITLVNNGKYIISTVDLSPHETYVFSAENEKIKDFGELDGIRYDTRFDAEEGHKVMCAKWDEKGE